MCVIVKTVVEWSFSNLEISLFYFNGAKSTPQNYIFIIFVKFFFYG